MYVCMYVCVCVCMYVRTYEASQVCIDTFQKFGNSGVSCEIWSFHGSEDRIHGFMVKASNFMGFMFRNRHSTWGKSAAIRFHIYDNRSKNKASVAAQGTV
jgi:hypothetical protein